MLTKLIIRNFKRFGEVEIELGNPVVFIGPNNSGKTSALQALALWQLGLNRWNERRKGKTAPEKRSGVAINRRDVLAVPVPNALAFWRNLHVRDVRKTKGRQETQNIRVDISLEGVTQDRAWSCGFEFDYANEESFYCRPLRLSEGLNPDRMPVPEEAASVQMAFLPPMSGLAATEYRLEPGTVNVHIGEGRTAEVLRNLCHRLHMSSHEKWDRLVADLKSLFGAQLDVPVYVPERGELVLTYRESGTRLDLSCSGRGLQQTLHLLAHMHLNPGAVLLLDEPDAHLEILRQRQIYQQLSDAARENRNQIIAASHSEILLNEAAERDVVVAFVGKPHRIDNRGSQVKKALSEIGFEHYYQAEQTGWVLYLEGSTDLAILRQLANRLGHKEAVSALERPFVHYVGNSPIEALRHFHGLHEALPGLKAAALFDRLDRTPPQDPGIAFATWGRREIENYLCYPGTLEEYAKAQAAQLGPIFEWAESPRRLEAMKTATQDVERAMATLKRGSPWSPDTKVSDDFLIPVFEKYFEALALPNLMAKKNLHELAAFVPLDKLDPEIREKLDTIARVAASAKPAQEEQ